MVSVDRRCNLTFPVDRDDGPAHIISMPISQAVFETYFLAITKTYVALRENGPEWFMRIGPTVAALTLKTVAVKDDVWEGDGGVEQGLMAEIRRLTQVALPGPDGWSTIPFQEARDRKRLSPEDISEVENALVFFYCHLGFRPEAGDGGHAENGGWSVGRVLDLLQRYGLRCFIADLDHGREYWREGESVVPSALTWASEEGFADLMAELELGWESALEFRQRLLIQAMKRM